MTVLSAPTYYRGGSSGASSCIGMENGVSRVVRFSFTTGSTGATNISISVAAGTIQTLRGYLTRIAFYISTSSDGYKNAKESDTYKATGYITGSSGNVYSGSAEVTLLANTTYYLWFFPIQSSAYDCVSYWHNSGSYKTSYETTGTSKFTLSINAGTGSSITVTRLSSKAVSSGVSSPGSSKGDELSNGSAIYKGDVLKISFTPEPNYSIAAHTVNGSTFTSGNTHTVSGNVTVVATATPLKSTIGATDANIGSTSTITVTRYNSSYTHTITYKLSNATGTIVTKGTSTSIAWTVPDAFYAQIPNTKTGTCTLTIETFNGSTSLGTNTCTLKVTASSYACSPTVVGTVVDTNTTTKALTGNENTLIRYKSTAKCTLTATPNNSATISTTKIGGSAVTGTASDGVVTATKNYTSVSATSFAFEATDSRGYTSSKTVTPEMMISYIPLTINPTFVRQTPTGGEVKLSFNGNYYRGTFGAYDNTLTIKYRYKAIDGSWTDWTTVQSTSIVYGNGTYRSGNDTVDTITINGTFDYRKSYDFQIEAYDGANGIKLTSVTQNLVIKRGIPVFDWGENDFNFHVPVKIGDTELTEQQLQQLLALLS